LINLLYVATKLESFIQKLKELLKKENGKIFIPKIIVDREVTEEDQSRLLKRLVDEGMISLAEVIENEIKKMKRLYSFRLGDGEIGMLILVKNFLREGSAAAGFTNDKLAIKKWKDEIPLLHGLWFYVQMFYYNLLSKEELDEVINISNEDMKIKKVELERIKEEYINKKAILEKIINEFISRKKLI